VQAIGAGATMSIWTWKMPQTLRSWLVVLGWAIFGGLLMMIVFLSDTNDRLEWMSGEAIAAGLVFSLLVAERIWTWRSRKRGTTTFLDRPMRRPRQKILALLWGWLAINLVWLPISLWSPVFSVASQWKYARRYAINAAVLLAVLTIEFLYHRTHPPREKELTERQERLAGGWISLAGLTVITLYSIATTTFSRAEALKIQTPMIVFIAGLLVYLVYSTLRPTRKVQRPS
jgi:hypothetical protein